jgi:hypothetical protein
LHVNTCNSQVGTEIFIQYISIEIIELPTICNDISRNNLSTCN